MLEITTGPPNNPDPRLSGATGARADTQNAGSNAQTTYDNERDEAAKEAQLSRDVESYFQDEPEYTVVVEDFRTALDAQLAYYKQRIAMLRELCYKACKERDEAEHSIVAEEAKVGSPTRSDDRFRQAINDIQSAVHEGSQRLSVLTNLLPASLKQDMSVSTLGRTSASNTTGDDLGINALGDNINQFIQSAIQLIQLYNKAQIGSSNSQVQLTRQTHPETRTGGEKKSKTCHQRKKERDFEIERLEDQIRLAGGLVTDLLVQSDMILSDLETGPTETNVIDWTDEMVWADDTIQPFPEDIQAPPEQDDKLKHYIDQLQKQIIADPTAESLNNRIAEIEVDILREEVTATGGKEEPKKSKSSSELMKSSLERQDEGSEISTAASSKQPQAVQDTDDIDAIAPNHTEDAVAVGKRCDMVLKGKNQIIVALSKDLNDAQYLNDTYRQEMQQLKRDAAAKVGDLQKRLVKCLSKHKGVLPTVSAFERGGGGGNNSGDDGGNYWNDDEDGGNGVNDGGDDGDDGGQPPMQPSRPKKPRPQQSQSNGGQSVFPQSHGLPSQVLPPEDFPSNGLRSKLSQSKKNQSKQSQLQSTPRAKTPRPPPELSTPQAPRKRRRVGEPRSALKLLTEEGDKFKLWPSSCKKLNRPGF